MMSTRSSWGISMIELNGQCWRATRRQVMSSYGCQVRYLWLARNRGKPLPRRFTFLETGGGFLFVFFSPPTSSGINSPTHIQLHRLLLTSQDIIYATYPNGQFIKPRSPAKSPPPSRETCADLLPVKVLPAACAHIAFLRWLASRYLGR